jgi:hypothetical protein
MIKSYLKPLMQKRKPSTENRLRIITDNSKNRLQKFSIGPKYIIVWG